MDGIHDMGGMDGFGPVELAPEVDEPVFHAPWEARVFGLAMLVTAAGVTNVDAFRHAVESVAPAVYLRAGYYGRWLIALERMLVEVGIVTAAELSAAGGEGEARGIEWRPIRPLGRGVPGAGGARRAIETVPRHAVGDRVRVRNLHPRGHTRLPRYVRGHLGAVARVHPAWVFPDSNAHGLGKRPQYVYAVRFAAEELWGPDADPSAVVHVDLFESYLDVVPA